jgi:hypothetical protein
MRASGSIAVLLSLGLIAADAGSTRLGHRRPGRPPAPAMAIGRLDRKRDQATACCAVARGLARPHTRLRPALGGDHPGTRGRDSPQQVLFFNRNTPLGTPTPHPRPYITVTTTGTPGRRAVPVAPGSGRRVRAVRTGIGTVRSGNRGREAQGARSHSHRRGWRSAPTASLNR